MKESYGAIEKKRFFPDKEQKCWNCLKTVFGRIPKVGNIIPREEEEKGGGGNTALPAAAPICIYSRRL